MTKKRVLSLLLAILLFLLSVPAAAQDFNTVAGVAALMEASTGQLLYLKNADEPRPPASITKVMTLLLSFEAIESGEIQWDTTTIVSERAWQKEGSSMFLQVDTEVSVEELISGMSIVSANDGCIAMAELLAGSEEAFVQRMNQRAQELGMTNTQFQNATGLPAENHYMSARDIAILARELIVKHPKILEFESQREYTYNNIKQQNRNPLLGRFQGADGLKTGWTPESGYSLAGTAEQNGMRLITVTLNTGSDQERLIASQELLNYGFRNFVFTQPAAKDDALGETPVKDGKKQTVALTVTEDLIVLAPPNRAGDLKLVVAEEKTLQAPVEQGSQAATLLVQLDGETIASKPLVTATKVPRANIFVRFFRSIANFIRGLIKRA
ncbi:MAG TPA: D-alanyl-D-alanine carboxypeptidase family protein [Oscillospiraceae bacterium]|nr:D-alanyl-D-alanine carboxypeptidase family protein [Oscillospiraceae bacterium]